MEHARNGTKDEFTLINLLVMIASRAAAIAACLNDAESQEHVRQMTLISVWGMKARKKTIDTASINAAASKAAVYVKIAHRVEEAASWACHRRGIVQPQDKEDVRQATWTFLWSMMDAGMTITDLDILRAADRGTNRFRTTRRRGEVSYDAVSANAGSEDLDISIDPPSPPEVPLDERVRETLNAMIDQVPEDTRITLAAWDVYDDHNRRTATSPEVLITLSANTASLVRVSHAPVMAQVNTWDQEDASYAHDPDALIRYQNKRRAQIYRLRQKALLHLLGSTGPLQK